jgi:hypothetical protein
VKENHQVVVGSRPEPDVESHSSRQNNPVNDKTTIQLTRIGQQLLALDFIGIDQNFFDLEKRMPPRGFYEQFRKSLGRSPEKTARRFNGSAIRLLIMPVAYEIASDNARS